MKIVDIKKSEEFVFPNLEFQFVLDDDLKKMKESERADYYQQKDSIVNSLRAQGYEVNTLPDETEPDTGESIQQMVDRCVRINGMSKAEMNKLINNGVILPEWLQRDIDDNSREYKPEDLSGLTLYQAEDLLDSYDFRAELLEEHIARLRANSDSAEMPDGDLFSEQTGNNESSDENSEPDGALPESEKK